MTAAQVESRLTQLEREVARLKEQIAAAPSRNNWVEEIAGTFANDPVFEEAVRLGRKRRQTEPVKRGCAKRSGKGSREAFGRILAKVPARKPVKGDGRRGRNEVGLGGALVV